MNRSKILAAAVLAATAAGASLLLGAASATAATTPPWEPDGNSEGNIAFYDASGSVITGGNDLSHLFDYAAATTAPVSTTRHTTRAQVFFAFPDHTNSVLETWFQSPGTSSTTYPNTSAPAPVNAITFPVAAAAPAEANLSAALGGAVLDSSAGYANIVQLRLYDSGAGLGNGKQTTPYWQADISYDTTANTWTQVYPAPAAPAVNTTTALAAAPSPGTVGAPVTLTATVSAADSSTPAGSVQFKDGATNLGSPQTVNGAGKATFTTSSLNLGSHSLSADFTATDPTAYKLSSDSTTEQINPPATSTSLAVSGNTSVDGNDETFTATVSPSSAPGAVAFYDNGSATAISGTVSNSSPGVYVLTLTGGLGVGNHSVVAKFTPTDPNAFSPSASPAATFHTDAASSPCAQPGSVCTDAQNIQATIPVGTLVINTPYTSTDPLDLGTLALDSTGTYFTGNKAFHNIKVTDTRSGALPWTASAQSSALSDGGTNPGSKIDAQNVGLTGLTFTTGAGFSGTVAVSSNPAATPPVAPGASGSQGLGGGTAHSIATATHGPGTVTMDGSLTINAPASTEAGLFKGIITFTVG
jgi:hypothetical protein